MENNVKIILDTPGLYIQENLCNKKQEEGYLIYNPLNPYNVNFLPEERRRELLHKYNLAIYPLGCDIPARYAYSLFDFIDTHKDGKFIIIYPETGLHINLQEKVIKSIVDNNINDVYVVTNSPDIISVYDEFIIDQGKEV